MNASNTLKKYRVKPIAEFEWDHEKLVRLEISIGQKYHEAGRLKVAVDWADNNFDQTVVVVLDTIQRYNMMFSGVEANVAYQQSREAGDQWIDRNKDIIGDATIIRWDEITSDEGFPDALQKVRNLYENVSLVKEEIDSAIDNVAQRRNIDDTQSDFFKRLSQNYLIEEIAGTAVANRLYPGVCAYPGDLPGLWHVVNDLPEAMLPEGLKTARSIKLKIGN